MLLSPFRFYFLISAALHFLCLSARIYELPCYAVAHPGFQCYSFASHFDSANILCSDLRFLSVAFRFVGSLYHALAQLYCSAPFHGFSLPSLSWLFLCFSAHDGASLFHSPSTQHFSLPSRIMPTRCYSFASPCQSILCLALAFQFSAALFLSIAISAMPLQIEFC